MRQIVIVAGSGISMSPPSNLPNWWQYNTELIKVIKEKALVRCPESEDILDLIDVQKSLPVQCISDVIVSQGAGQSYFPLLSLLNSTHPNLNHLSTAKLADNNVLKAIVTTNFDSLFEEAFKVSAVPLFVAFNNETFDEVPQSPSCKLLKIHGTIYDNDSLIDTVTQKAVGLSNIKRAILKGIFKDSEIVFMGFSGADLDFDIDYIPIQEAVQSGSTITWIVKPGTTTNPNVKKLESIYKKDFNILSMETSDYFKSLGVDIDLISANLSVSPADEVSDTLVLDNIHNSIEKLFSKPHIGTDGCVGLCISLLFMIGEVKAASSLATIYESKLDPKALDVISIPALIPLGLQKMRDGNMERAKLWFSSAIQCLDSLFEIAKESIELKPNDGISLLPVIQEYSSNLATCYTNLGLIFLHEKDVEKAINCFKSAKNHVEESKNPRQLGIILFNLARAEYEKDKDDDQYLSDLKKCVALSHNAGNMYSFAEILEQECELRMELGEYYIAQRNLDELEMALKNVGSFILDFKFLLLKAELLLRCCKTDESLEYFERAFSVIKDKQSISLATELLANIYEMYSNYAQVETLVTKLCQIYNIDSKAIKSEFEKKNQKLSEQNIKLPLLLLNKLPRSIVRQNIIINEYLRKTDLLPSLFQNLCIKYVKESKWSRLIDVAKCYYDSSISQSDQSVALYYIGCGFQETNDFVKAVKYYEKVICLDKANPLYLGWSNIELAKLYLQQQKHTPAENYYYSAVKALMGSESTSSIIEICMSYVTKAIELEQWDMASNHINKLLKIVEDPQQKIALQNTIEYIKKKQSQETANTDLDIDNSSAEEIATKALFLFNKNISKDRAWELIKISKDKYEKRGDIIGVSKCENNMALFCLTDGNKKDAATHLKNSLVIRQQAGDVEGSISQLASLISILLSEGENVQDYIDYAEMHLPEYEEYIGRYSLYYSLFLFYFASDHGKALKYARLALQGIDYLENTIKPKDIKKMLSDYVDAIEKYYSSSVSSNSDNFNDKLKKAISFYKTGKLDKSISMLDDLKEEVRSDSLKLGQVEGTIGNGYLMHKHYVDALQHFNEAIKIFSTLDTDDASIENHLLTAYNGIALSLDGQGKTEESINYLRTVLSEKNIGQRCYFPLSVNLCNRLITSKEDIKKDDETYNEITSFINKINTIKGLTHDERGTLYHLSGLLDYAVSDFPSAIEKFKSARKEYYICNSPNLKATEIMLDQAIQATNKK